jgi:hypothetical protein
MLGRQLTKLESMPREVTEDITAFADFPVPHWKKIWSTNPLERLNKRSSAVPMSSASYPTPRRCRAWPDRSSSRPTTNGRSPTSATCPKPLWRCSIPPTNPSRTLRPKPLPRRSEKSQSLRRTPARLIPLRGARPGRYAIAVTTFLLAERTNDAQAGPGGHLGAVRECGDAVANPSGCQGRDICNRPPELGQVLVVITPTGRQWRNRLQNSPAGAGR